MTREERETIRENTQTALSFPTLPTRAAILTILDALEQAERERDASETVAIYTLERFRDKCGWCRDQKTCVHNMD